MLVHAFMIRTSSHLALVVPRPKRNHGVERDEDAALGPIDLSVGRNLVHEQARADEERDSEQIEEQLQGLVGP